MTKHKNKNKNAVRLKLITIFPTHSTRCSTIVLFFLFRLIFQTDICKCGIEQTLRITAQSALAHSLCSMWSNINVRFGVVLKLGDKDKVDKKKKQTAKCHIYQMISSLIQVGPIYGVLHKLAFHRGWKCIVGGSLNFFPHPRSQSVRAPQVLLLTFVGLFRCMMHKQSLDEKLLLGGKIYSVSNQFKFKF